jgi:hypothetical protein
MKRHPQARCTHQGRSQSGCAPEAGAAAASCLVGCTARAAACRIGGAARAGARRVRVVAVAARRGGRRGRRCTPGEGRVRCCLQDWGRARRCTLSRGHDHGGGHDRRISRAAALLVLHLRVGASRVCYEQKPPQPDSGGTCASVRRRHAREGLRGSNRYG